ncbi:hypothetical protein WA158_004161 [Blastocystis sp. Blastoise]
MSINMQSQECIFGETTSCVVNPFSEELSFVSSYNYDDFSLFDENYGFCNNTQNDTEYNLSGFPIESEFNVVNPDELNDTIQTPDLSPIQFLESSDSTSLNSCSLDNQNSSINSNTSSCFINSTIGSSISPSSSFDISTCSFSTPSNSTNETLSCSYSDNSAFDLIPTVSNEYTLFNSNSTINNNSINNYESNNDVKTSLTSSYYINLMKEDLKQQAKERRAYRMKVLQYKREIGAIQYGYSIKYQDRRIKALNRPRANGKFGKN